MDEIKHRSMIRSGKLKPKHFSVWKLFNTFRSKYLRSQVPLRRAAMRMLRSLKAFIHKNNLLVFYLDFKSWD